MQRSTSSVQIGDGQTRYRVRIVGDPSPQHEVDARASLLSILQTVLDSPDLLSCGYSTAQKINIYHSGTSWVIDAEAVTKDI